MNIADIEKGIAAGLYYDDWDSLGEWNVPRWFDKAKFGIFIHWGVFSVPAFANEWYPRNMYIRGNPAFDHHVKTYGPHKDFGYKDFIPRFTMEKFDAEEWASVFKEAGALYAVPLAEHHDGFQMYPSAFSRWNAAEMGPRRDLLGSLRKALLDAGLEFCTSSHRAEHWFFLGHGKDFDSDIKEPLVRGDFYWPSMKEGDHKDLFSKPEPSPEFLEDWLLRCCEIADRYTPAFVYFDWWVHHSAFKPYMQKFAAYYYNRLAREGREGAICYKYDGLAFGTGIVEVERGGFSESKAYKWQTDTAAAKNSWGYVEGLEYKNPVDIIRQLVDVVSKNGNLLLNVGPRADGTLPSGDLSILRTIGGWLKVNGEGIYDSKPWRVFREGPVNNSEGQFQDNDGLPYTSSDFRFTVRGASVYAFAMAPPADGRLLVKSLGLSEDADKPSFHGIIKDVRALGIDKKPVWKRTAQGLEVELGPLPPGSPPVALKVTCV